MAKERLPLARASALANELFSVFNVATERIQIAGSIRRRKAEVGDVELVMVPRIEMVANPADLFGAEIPVNRQYELATVLRDRGVLTDRLDVNGRQCFGPLYQRVVYKGFAVDLFCCEPAHWGITLAIRTGDAKFSQRLVTPRADGGFLLTGQRVQGWRLHDLGRVVDTPEEEDFFHAIGLDWIAPEDRNG